jgi:hypothetical protein
MVPGPVDTEFLGILPQHQGTDSSEREWLEGLTNAWSSSRKAPGLISVEERIRIDPQLKVSRRLMTRASHLIGGITVDRSAKTTRYFRAVASPAPAERSRTICCNPRTPRTPRTPCGPPSLLPTDLVALHGAGCSDSSTRNCQLGGPNVTVSHGGCSMQRAPTRAGQPHPHPTSTCRQCSEAGKKRWRPPFALFPSLVNPGVGSASQTPLIDWSCFARLQ